MTNEEIKKILDGAPRNTNQYEDCGKYWYVVGGSDIYLESPMHHLSDLRRILEQDATILELRQEVERLKAQLPKWISMKDKYERLVMAAETLVYVMQNNMTTTAALMDMEDTLWGLQNTQQESS